MMSFRGTRLQDTKLPLSIVWLLETLAESKGRQQLFEKQSPQLLKSLREMALIESTESSNRIEGVTVERKRLRPLVIGNTRPRDRSPPTTFQGQWRSYAWRIGMPLTSCRSRHLWRQRALYWISFAFTHFETETAAYPGC